MSNKKTYIKLFTSVFYLSAFTIGGGYVIVPLMKEKFVDELKWLEEEEMLNLIAIAQSSPGPIAVNASILLGYRIAGFTGALVAILGTVLPPLITLSILSIFYTAFRDNAVVAAVLKGMQAGVSAVIVDAVINMGSKVVAGKQILSIGIMLLAFMATFFLKINVVLIVLAFGALGGVLALRKEARQKKEA